MARKAWLLWRSMSTRSAKTRSDVLIAPLLRPLNQRRCRRFVGRHIRRRRFAGRAAKSAVWQSLQPPTISMYLPRSIALRLVDAAGFFAGAVSAAVAMGDAARSATVAAVVAK